MVGAITLASALSLNVQAGVGACLITKTDTTPFFVNMKEGAKKKAEE